MSNVYQPPKKVPKNAANENFDGYSVARIAYKGVFDWDAVYKYVMEWFSERKYEFDEDDYKHKEGTKIGIEEELKWKGNRKINAYYRYFITIEVHSWDMRRVEVIENGKKKKLWKGRILMEFYAEVKADWQGIWKNGPLAFELKKFVDQYVHRPERNAVWVDRLYYITYKLQAGVREILKMESKNNAHEHRW
ncbi:MAG: hypothetical protein KAQ83_02420 [Nanoarchaeota archaeon]|nr:hypothetical protein [Nanoarchaeota archaeon]